MRGLGWFAAAAALAACDGGGGQSEIDEILALPADSSNGAAVYLARCALCHGDAGEGGSGPALQGLADDPNLLIGVVLDGTGSMSGFRDLLTQQEIADLYAYLAESILTGAG
jgi:mono/diheme cytochrome c family protein